MLGWLKSRRNDHPAVKTPRFLVSIEDAYKTDKICVRRSKLHRWGVFATAKIGKNEVLEDSPYIAIPADQLSNAPAVEPYTYWLEDQDSLLGLGFAGLYNHSFQPNADYQVDKVSEVIRHYAIRDIEPGEEITLNYGIDNATFEINS